MGKGRRAKAEIDPQITPVPSAGFSRGATGQAQITRIRKKGSAAYATLRRAKEVAPVEFPWGSPIQLGKEVIYQMSGKCVETVFF